jgi:hypothetical protein
VNRGLIAKTLREIWPGTLVFGWAIFVTEVLLAYMIPMFMKDEVAGQWLELEFVQDIFKGLLGTEVASALSPGAMNAIAWVHPIVLTLIWAQEISYCTRLPAGEIDRGTVDVLLGLPVSRLRVYLCESAVWLFSGCWMLGLGLLGNVAGGWLATTETENAADSVIIVVVNFYCLYMAVGGMTFFVSSLSDRRGPAMGVAFAMVLASFVLNFLAQFQETMESISFLSILSYYQPLLILRDSSWPITDIVVLTTVGAVCWLMGAIVFARRDICTV